LKQEQLEVERAALAEAESVNANMKRSSRAARRTELHHANLAGKGGLLLDTKAIERTYGKSNDTGVASIKTASTIISSSVVISPKVDEKLAASWDIEDCRGWLLHASRRIAQRWVEERKNEGAMAKLIPSGSVDDLEGLLVEHSISLCEHLENDLKAEKQGGGQVSGRGKNRVRTPRVTDMSKLGIAWQKASTSMTGSSSATGHAPGRNGTNIATTQRTAGQILILKTAKSLSAILKDEIAGEAIHKELRTLIARQEERKRHERLEEASRQRFNQMQRKPWLQARAQVTL
jgi:hypothetical protein